jgi:hypothetical protein
MERGDFKILVAIVAAFLVMAAGLLVWLPPPYPQATGIFPQVISCVPQHEPERHTGPNWQPTLRVKVEPPRDPGRVREYRVLGCSLYYYHAHFK